MKTILYARVSSKEQEQEGFSIPAQLKSLKEYAQKQGLEIVREFVDVIKGMTEKAEQGHFPSKAPLGYRHNGETHCIELEPEGAGIVKQLYEWYATGSYSFRQVSEKAHREGLRHTRSGRRLSQSEAEWILKNPIYYGAFRWRGKLYPGKHAPLVTKELFDTVQTVAHRFNKPKYRKHEFAFAGLLTCGRCGCTITAEIKKGRYVYYHCTNGRGQCEQPWVREEVLDEQIARLVRSVEMTEQEFTTLQKALRMSHQDEQAYHDGQLAALNAHYAALQRRLDQVYLDKLDGKITEEFWREKHEAWRQEQQAALRQIEHHQHANGAYFTEGVKLIELAQQAHALYVTKPPEEKRTLLRLLLSNCTLVDATLTPTYNKPFCWIVEARQNGNGCPAWIRTKTPRSRVSCATVTLRGNELPEVRGQRSDVRKSRYLTSEFCLLISDYQDEDYITDGGERGW